MIESYLHAHTTIPDLQEKDLNFSDPKEKMSCGHLVGSLLQCLIYMHQPRYILELGTMLGYSALCMAKVVGEGSVVHSVERNPDYYERAVSNARYAGLQKKTHFHLMEVLRFLDIMEAYIGAEELDFVFIDADKVNYSLYYKKLFPYVKVGGIIVADNAFFHQEVLAEKKNKYATAIDDFNTLVQADDRVHNVLLPLRDGVQLIYKLKA